jgi:hypothetical protein
VEAGRLFVVTGGERALSESGSGGVEFELLY